MKKYSFIKVNILIATIILLISSIVVPMAMGNNDIASDKKILVENYKFDRHLYPEYYDYYNILEIPDSKKYINREHSDNDNTSPDIIINPVMNHQLTDSPPMNSPWPMHSHDARHTGQSIYNTVDTWDEIWHVKDEKYFMKGSPVIDKNGTIYTSSLDLYAIYPNGTIKWTFDTNGYIWSAPAIDKNGTIYVGTVYGDPSMMYAINPDGTRKWGISSENIQSSPAISEDGIIYYVDTENQKLWAVKPDGKTKWSFEANHLIFSSPAIADDGTIYFGSIDENVYALYSNGTLKWKFNTGSWVHGSPTIGDDGTVYIGSDNKFYALYPNNGTMKWKQNTGAIWSTPVIDNNGIIYVGSWNGNLYAIYPNGTVKWKFDTGGRFWFGASPAISAEGTIYFGTTSFEGGSANFFAIYSDGSEKWRFKSGWIESSPAIGEDGIVYMSSCKTEQIGKTINTIGYLYAFGRSELEADANGPYYGLINEPLQFEGYSKGGYSPHTYLWDFGDTQESEEQNPIHTYVSAENFTVYLTVTDNESNTADDTTYAWIQDGNTLPNQPSIDGPARGKTGILYNFTFTSIDPDGSVIWYYIEWGDGKDTGWVGSYDSNIEIVRGHKWNDKGTYTIRCKSKDPYNAESEWSEYKITIPRTRASSYHWLWERFPMLERLLNLIIYT